MAMLQQLSVVCFAASEVDAMPLRLATLLTVVLLAVPSWSGDTNVAPKQRGKETQAEEQARAAQRAYEESLRSQCMALDGTPDCHFYQAEQQRQLRKRMEDEFCGGKCSELLPIPAEHPHKPILNKT
jgi:hypothetical protein